MTIRGLLGLPEDGGQVGVGHHPGADQVVKDLARPHRGQLVRIPHQHQPAVVGQGGQQGRHQGDVHHGGLVHDDRLAFQRLVLIALKGQLAGLRIVARLQQSVDGAGTFAAELPQPLGGPARGGAEQGFQPQGLKEAQNAPETGGFAGARAAG